MKIKRVITYNNELAIGKFTVLVGPNNVGKSRFLRDINDKLLSGTNARTTIIKNIEIERPANIQELLGEIHEAQDPNNTNQIILQGISSTMRTAEEVCTMQKSALEERLQSEPTDWLQGTLSRLFLAFLNAESRLLVANSAQISYPDRRHENLLQDLYYRDDARLNKDLEEIFSAAFSMDIKLDYSTLGKITFRVSKKFENIPENPRAAYQVLSKYPELETQGDGFRSFVGIVLSFLLSKKRIILLDEPEAFLHPAQARLLGRWIAQRSRIMDGQVFIATHNANFLSGILSVDADVEVYRLNRIDNQTYFRQIPSNITSKLAKSPLLSSQPVLESIFHTGVIVCEADSDRSFYQAIAIKEFDNPHVLFIHAHNKQTIKDIVTLLIKANIPVRAITDIDIINSAEEFRELLLSFGKDVPGMVLELRNKIAAQIERNDKNDTIDTLKQHLENLLHELEQDQHCLNGARRTIKRIYDKTSKWSHVKKYGVDGLPQDSRNDMTHLLSLSKSMGLFIVPVGELESWLHLEVNKKRWIISALEEVDRGNSTIELKKFVESILKDIDKD